MNRKWKLLATLMAVMMLLSALSGCNSASPAITPGATTTNSSASSATATPSTETTANGPDESVKGFSELHITVLGSLPTGSRAAVDDKLTPIWRAKTKVVPEIVQIPVDQDYTTWLQMQLAAGTLPDVIGITNGIFEIVERYKTLKDGNALKEIKLDDLVKYMPRTAARLQKLGVSMEEWYKANVDAGDGKLWYIPGLPNQALNKENRSLRFMQDKVGNYPYCVWVRDDILKTIYPQAKSEAELIKLWNDKGGKLTLEDVMDTPLTTPDAFYDYLKKVKELNLKVDNNPVIPAHLTLDNSAGAFMWSTFSWPGFWWSDAADTPYDANRGLFTEFTHTPEWKAWIQFNNKCFNEGLFGQEMFIQKDEQKAAKMINGEYAVMNWWAPVGDARAKAKEAGRTYGWRLVPIFMIPLKTQYQDISTTAYTVANSWGAKSFNPKTMTDDKIPQLLNWLDWNYSEEAMNLRTWGVPEFYTGEGEARRFKPEYKAIEQYMLTGKQDPNGKDGIYYGMISLKLNDRTIWNHEVYGLAEAGEYEIPYAPMYVYPEDTNNADSFIITMRVIRQSYLKDMKSFKEPGATAQILAAKAEYDKITQQLNDAAKPNNDARNTTFIKAISDKTSNFDANYKAYMDLYSAEQEALLKQQGEAWLKYYKLKMASWIPLD